METNNLKAILLKVALELKKLGWQPDAESAEIGLSQNYIEMIKNYSEDNVDVTIGIDLTLVKNETNNYVIEYNVVRSLWADRRGGEDVNSKEDVNIVFSDADVNNMEKIKAAAIQINKQEMLAVEQDVYNYQQMS